MSWVDKWNNFAKKSIYINNTFEIGCGRLVYAAIIFGIQLMWGFLAGATMLEMMPMILTWVVGLKQSSKEEE